LTACLGRLDFQSRQIAHFNGKTCGFEVGFLPTTLERATTQNPYKCQFINFCSIRRNLRGFRDAFQQKNNGALPKSTQRGIRVLSLSGKLGT
jgi:hypothetical protein